MENIRFFQTNEYPPLEIYKLLTNTIVPRPIAWVSTIGLDGDLNLAPYSFFNAISSKPATLMIAVARKPNGDKKDTHKNIEETKQFVVNNVSESSFDQMVSSAAIYEYGVSEFEKVGITPIPSKLVKPPRVKESLISFECSLYRIIDIDDNGEVNSSIIIGKIEGIHISESVYGEDGRIDPAKLSPIGRLGGISYTTLGAVLSKKIPEISS